MSLEDAPVVAVVLTHNRKELLTEGLEALLAQTRPVARIHVIDSASTDGTHEHLRERGLLDRPQVAYERLEENRGGAGGFAHGMQVARRDPDAAWIWLMDDDAEPAPDCLERMLAVPEAAEQPTVALCSAVRGRDGALQSMHRGTLAGRPKPLPDAAYAERAPQIGFATFVGLMVRADVARELDPPKAEFFIWVDDYEYCVRLRKRGAIRMVPSSVIVHKDVAPTYSNRRSRFFRRALGWDIHPSRYEAAWRNLYGIRNWVWMKQEHEGLSTLGFWREVAQFSAKALMFDERPLRRIPWLIRYARAGRRGTFENQAPEEWVAKVRRGEV